MPKGTCKNCGTVYHGWALLQEEHRTCGRCGGQIEVEEVNNDNT